MKLLYGTSNTGKLLAMRRSLRELPVNITSLKDQEGCLPDIEETGNSPLENARIKAGAYYESYNIPVFSCDTGLYFDTPGFPEALQPGVHVRNVDGRRLTDEEMTDYYAGLARTYGDLTARYRNAVCLIIDGKHRYESMAEDLSGEPFLLTSVPYPRRQPGFPLDCLSKNIRTGLYYYEMGDYSEDETAINNGFLKFFKTALQQVNVIK